MTKPRLASALRTVWLDLGWLVVLVVALGFPFVVDALGKLTYAWSLAFWVIPILYLIPLVPHADGRRAWPATPRPVADRRADRRARRRCSTSFSVRLTLTFPGCVVNDGRYLYCLAGRVPIEEILFYALGPIAMILVYAAADERWLQAYNPKDDLLNVKLLQISPPLVVTAVVAAALSDDRLAGAR